MDKLKQEFIQVLEDYIADWEKHAADWESAAANCQQSAQRCESMGKASHWQHEENWGLQAEAHRAEADVYHGLAKLARTRAEKYRPLLTRLKGLAEGASNGSRGRSERI